jgi:hypothetical protein
VGIHPEGCLSRQGDVLIIFHCLAGMALTRKEHVPWYDRRSLFMMSVLTVFPVLLLSNTAQNLDDACRCESEERKGTFTFSNKRTYMRDAKLRHSHNQIGKQLCHARLSTARQEMAP